MNCTLYIDESGDFESNRGEWVVAGILMPRKIAECDLILSETFKTLPQKVGCRSIKDFHLTEFRARFGHKKAVEMAAATLAALEATRLRPVCLATINAGKTAVVEKERTYRLMLSDLLALCETTLPEAEPLDSLSMVVASRTVNGTLRTSVSQITQDLFSALPEAFEVSLATRGLIGLLGNKITVTMDYANNSWGLVCADFIANLAYHRRRQSDEHELLKRMEETDKYIQFESFGGYELRQARVAERDRDYVTALFRWLLHTSKEGVDKNLIAASISRILGKVFASQTAAQPHATVEAVLERLWRTNRTPDRYESLSEMLKCFEENLTQVLIENNLSRFAYLAFRTRNMILMVDNHRGDTESAEFYSAKQRVLVQDLVSNPELFHLVLDFKTLETESLINLMDFKSALKKAHEYHNLIQGYKAVWELITEQPANDFGRSKISIKAEMGLLRCQLLDITGPIKENSDFFNMMTRFETLEKTLDSPPDISRLNNYKVMYFIKSGDPEKAVANVLKSYPAIRTAPIRDFDLFWFLRALNDALLCKNAALEQIPSSLTYAVEYAEIQIRMAKIESAGHPHDLVWREIALLKHQLGHKSKAIKALTKSKNCSLPVHSPILEHLNDLLGKHRKYIKNEIPDLEWQKYGHINLWLYHFRQGSPY